MEIPDRPSRDIVEDEEPQQKKLLNQLIPIVVPAVVSIVFALIYVNSVAGGLVAKEDIAAITESVNQAKSTLQTSIDGIPGAVTNQVNTSMSETTNQLNGMQSSINEMKTQVPTG